MSLLGAALERLGACGMLSRRVTSSAVDRPNAAFAAGSMIADMAVSRGSIMSVTARALSAERPRRLTVARIA